MEEDRPPIGLPEDEAYSTPPWVLAVVIMASLFTFMMAVALILHGAMILLDIIGSATYWEFWGNTAVLGLLFIASGLLLIGSLVLLDRRDGNGHVLLFMGVLLFEVVMLRGVLHVEDEGTRSLLFLVMLFPFLLLLAFQLREVRTHLIDRPGEED